MEYSSEDEFNEKDFHVEDESMIITTDRCSQTVQGSNKPPHLNFAAHSIISEDENDYFSKYLANKLRKYDNKTSAIVQHEISNIIFKADMGEFTQM